MSKPKQSIYRVIFIDQDSIYEIYASKIYESDIFGFIEVEDFIFGKNLALVVDPAEERLKMEFADVKRSYIPMQSVIRIDEVEREGTSKVKELKQGKTNISMLPGINLKKPDK